MAGKSGEMSERNERPTANGSRYKLAGSGEAVCQKTRFVAIAKKFAMRISLSLLVVF